MQYKIDLAAVQGLRNKGFTVAQVASQMGVHPATVYRRLMSAPKASQLKDSKPLSGILAAPKRAKNMKSPMPCSVEEAERLFNEYINYDGRERPHRVEHQNPSDTKKILLINDLHVPFHHEQALAKVIQDHADDTDELILGGDLLDLFAVSRYDKYRQHFTLKEELRAGKAVLLTLASHFKHIRLLSGNHDDRWKKSMVKRGLSPEYLEAMIFIAQDGSGDDGLDITDPLNCLARKIPNVEMVKPVVSGWAQFSFFTQIGDLVVSHAEKFSRVPGQAAVQAALWFKSYGEPDKLVQPFRVLAQCHTHQASTAWSNFGIWSMECGCLCRTPDYAANPKLMGAQRPSVLGCSVFFQTNGVTDMSRSRFIPIEV